MTDEILPALDVSRETVEHLRHFEALAQKWSRRINLVSSADLPDLWTRHILDSAQLARFAPESAASWVDLGSGGGFPALVLAILFREIRPDIAVTLVEADRRKAAFLHHAANELGLTVQIITQRLEAVQPLGSDVLSARALAPLSTLLSHAERHLSPHGVAILPKGRTWAEELAEARRNWQFELAIHESLTDDQARILIIEGLSRV